MEKVGIAVCDDEKVIHEEVERLFEIYQNAGGFSYKIYHCFSAQELLDKSDCLKIILLDIDMPGMDGIQAAKELEAKGEKKCIIMLTGKRERFKEAIKIGVVRFVTKPIEQDEFFEALDYAFLSLMGYGTIKLTYEGMQCLVQQRKIQVIESHRDYLKIYTGDKKFESYKTLKRLEEELDENLFILPYRGYLINLMHIVGIENGMIQMKGGFKIPISRRNKKEILQKIIDFDKFKN